MPRLPHARKTGMVTLVVGRQTIIQTLVGVTIARLDELDNAVWQSCTGDAPVDTIAKQMSDRFGRHIDRDMVWSVLDRLADSDLLEERVTPPAGETATTRRDWIARAAAVVGTAVATTVAMPRAANAARIFEVNSSRKSVKKPRKPPGKITGPPQEHQKKEQ
jgi:hypothetical protein